MASTLQKARDLISDPANWCEHGWGSEGQRCAIHAVYEVCGRNTTRDYYNAITALFRHAGGKSVSAFNDSGSHADVLDLFDRAIAETA